MNKASLQMDVVCRFSNKFGKGYMYKSDHPVLSGKAFYEYHEFVQELRRILRSYEFDTSVCRSSDNGNTIETEMVCSRIDKKISAVFNVSIEYHPGAEDCALCATVNDKEEWELSSVVVFGRKLEGYDDVLDYIKLKLQSLLY